MSKEALIKETQELTNSFYEAEKQLTIQDRRALHHLFFTVDNEGTMMTAGISLGVGLTAVLLKYFVFEGGIISFIFVFIIGFFISWRYSATRMNNRVYKRKLVELPLNERCLRITSFLTAESASQWENYYLITQSNPERIIKDPKNLSSGTLKSLSKLLK